MLPKNNKRTLEYFSLPCLGKSNSLMTACGRLVSIQMIVAGEFLLP